MTGRPLLVAGAILGDGGGRYLLTRRPPGSTWAGAWELPGGKVEAGEDVFAAIVRELREELDVETRPLLLHSAGRDDDGGRPIILSAVEVEIVAGHPRPTDGREMKWIAAADLRRLPLPRADLPIVEALLAENAGAALRKRLWADVEGARSAWACRLGPTRTGTIRPADATPTGWRSWVEGGVRLVLAAGLDAGSALDDSGGVRAARQ